LDPNKFLLEDTHSIFHLRRTLYFSLLSFNECSLFLELRLAFVFRLDFYSDLVISFHRGVFRPLVYVSFYQKSCLEKVWIVLEKRKSFMQKVVQKGACLDCGLDFACHACCHFDSMLSSFCCSMTSLKWLRLLNVPLKKSCVVFIIWKHFIVVFSLMLYLGWLGACLQHVWL
jgi:hypothetical protein